MVLWVSTLILFSYSIIFLIFSNEFLFYSQMKLWFAFCYKNGETGLHLAAAMGQVEMARLLLMCGANVALADAEGDTALIHAARHASISILVMLIKAGACISVQNQVDTNCLIHALPFSFKYAFLL